MFLIVSSFDAFYCFSLKRFIMFLIISSFDSSRIFGLLNFFQCREHFCYFLNYKDLESYFEIYCNFYYRVVGTQSINQSSQFFIFSFPKLPIPFLDMMNCLQIGFSFLNFFIFLIFLTFFNLINLTVYIFKFSCWSFAFFFRKCFLSSNKRFIAFIF